MSESVRKKQRMSAHDATDIDNPSTIYDDLQRLASVAPKPVTPYRRAASASVVTPRTPLTGRTPRGGPATRPISGKRVAPTTPHAIRALRERANAAKTPGRVRRRSGRVQRETPRDILRDLSRALAPHTRPTQPSPQVPFRPSRHSALDLPDIDDEPDPAAPRLSIPIGDMYDDDDSVHEPPPRQSLLPNLPEDVDDDTIHSLEFGRRALSEDPRMMYSGRASERFADLSDFGVDGEEYEIDGTFINRRRTMNRDDLLDQVPEEEDLDETTAEMLTGRRGGRPSDVDLGVFGDMDDDDTEPTFRFTIPPRMQGPNQEEGEDTQTRNLANQTILEEEEDTQTRNLANQTILGEEEEAEEMEEDVGAGAGAELGQDETTTAFQVNNDADGFQQIGWESEPEEDDDGDLQAYRGEVSAIDRSLQTPAPDDVDAQKRVGRQRKALNVSRFGHEYPSIPAATVKKLATGFMKSQGSKAKISKDTLAALVQASDFFFEQVGEDLAAYAQHGGRKVIEESDVIALMKRTRQVTNSSTTFSLAQKLLPRELLQQLRMEPLSKPMRQKRKQKEMTHEDGGDD
ncbi:hypothetical protein P280DRAFT_244781 [Massarina eburnea CBS 473.64]|uniref:CENP-T/Histone H4 histone fold domain-containing protein n=1 Tax=Massarina eburnea CBS 473.64 TaxID=1395130 RepID=A0A6A6S7F1_9PLEO|nr:hypothetical protein P280DRAFT_244781 [Massarina eburnea CBS 473.64]